MVVEVVLRQVRERRHLKARARDAVEVDGVARDLERGHVAAGVDHIREQLLEVARLGGRVKRRAHLGADMALDRAHEAGRRAGDLRDVLGQKRRGGLAVRARDAHELELGRWAPVEVGRAQGERLSRVFDQELRGLDVEPVLDYQSAGAVLDGIGSVRVPIGLCARHAEKQRPLAAVAGGELQR